VLVKRIRAREPKHKTLRFSESRAQGKDVIAEEAIQRPTRGDKGSDLERERRDAEREAEAGSGGRGTGARKRLNKRVERIFYV
jgi:hypothetical protein